MADFSTTAELELEVPNSTLRDARSKIEQELGNIEVGVSAEGGAGGGQLGDILDTNRRQLELMEEQTELLDEIEENITGGSGGGLLAGAAGGRAAAGRGIGGGVLSGILSSLTAFAPAARVAGGGISPGLFGKGGVLEGGEQELGPLMSLLTGQETATLKPPSEQSMQLSMPSELEDFEWPDPPDLQALEWPELPSFQEETWPDIPDLSTQVQWPQPPQIFQDLFGDGKTTSASGERRGFDGTVKPNAQPQIDINVGDIVTNIETDIQNAVDDAVRGVESDINSAFSDLERRIERALGGLGL